MRKKNTKAITLLVAAIIASLIISGCTERTAMPDIEKGAAPALNSNSTVLQPPALSVDPKEKLEKEQALIEVIAPTDNPEPTIPVSEIPNILIVSPGAVLQGENFLVTLMLENSSNQKIVAIEANISAENKIKMYSVEVISNNTGADKIIDGGNITYADTGGIAGNFADIKFYASKKGTAEITVRAMVIDEALSAAELSSKQTILIS